MVRFSERGIHGKTVHLSQKGWNYLDSVDVSKLRQDSASHRDLKLLVNINHGENLDDVVDDYDWNESRVAGHTTRRYMDGAKRLYSKGLIEIGESNTDFTVGYTEGLPEYQRILDKVPGVLDKR